MKCDKLESITAYKLTTNTEDSDVYIHNDELGCGGDAVQVYIKSEVDEVIEELNRQIKFLQVTNSSKCYECNKCADGMGKVFDETLDELKKEKAYLLEHTTEVINSQERVIRRQKYKRCLVLAKWCNERYILDDCLYNLGKTRFYERWENRWLNIAEQFKEAK